ncbi:MAG TPA: hypothetical protein VK034_20765, partial [Enhygromyxa sp.]|nr:hypothetical protein [Enhygromyxa sp.]
MATEPGKRSPRKGGSGLADPETVAKVSHATARSVHAIVTVSGVVARFVARNSIAFAKWAAPRLQRAAVASARGTWWTISTLARWLWTRKRGVAGVGHRVLWWSALA